MMRGGVTVRFQIIFLVASLSLLFGAFTALYFPARQEASELRALQEQLDSIHQLSASLIGPSIVFSDYEGIRNTAAFVLENENAAFIAVYDDMGETIAEVSQEGYQSVLEEFSAQQDKKAFQMNGLIVNVAPVVTELGESGLLVIAFSTARAVNIAKQSRNMSLLIALGFILLGTMAAFALGFIMGRPLSALAESFSAMSLGKLSDDVPEKGAREFVALAQAFNRTSNVLRDVFDKTSGAAGDLHGIVNRIDQDSSGLGLNSDNLTRAVSEVSTSVEEIATQIQTVVENTEKLEFDLGSAASEVRNVQSGAVEMRDNGQELASKFNELGSTLATMIDGLTGMTTEIQSWEGQAGSIVSDAERGQGIISEIVKQVRASIEAFQVIRTQFDELGHELEQISTVIGSLQAVSDRTHILALNASIEAARAGAAGKGFSVVAQEIRKLAAQSVQSMRRVEDSVETVLNKRVEVHRTVEESTGKAERGLQDITDATDRLENIVTGVQQILQLTSSLSATVQQQETGVSDINHYMDDVKAFAEAVRQVSNRQYDETNTIVGTMDSLVHLSSIIKSATAEQYNGGQLILRSIQNVDQIARDSQETARNLENTVGSLVEQQETLQEATSFFEADGTQKKGEEPLEDSSPS